MHLKLRLPCILLIGILLLVYFAPNALASNYDRTYSSQVQFGIVNHELFVSAPSSLYDYYHGKLHSISDDSEYANLVTPDAVSPIAENIRNLTRDKPRSDEEFANAALMLVHQIPYDVSDVKYPVETLVENSGKCDTVSLLAASIMKAGGLDVVLLYFKEVHHMNVGVYLPYEPHGTWWWQQPTGYEFDGKKYWIAECTPATEWKVGDVPPLLVNAEPTFISLENSEKSSPAQVSAKLDSPLTPSSISINLSSDSLDIDKAERTLTISGSISPAYQNESVVVYLSQNGISYKVSTTETDQFGNYSLNLNLPSTGTYYARTSWSGTSDCAGADSETLTVFIGFPKSLIQFEGPGFYYVYGWAGAASYELRVRQGVEEFLNIQLSGTGVLLTGELITVRSGQAVTIPRVGEPPVPITEIPIRKGMQPLRLPDDIEESTNNQFGFVLRNSGGDNYTVDVRGLSDYDLPQNNQLGENRTAVINASTDIRENTWYKVEARISEDKITAELHDMNGTLLECMASTYDARNISELVILLTNNTDKAVAFRNLKVVSLSQPAQPAEDAKSDVDGSDLFAPYVNVAVVLAAALVAVAYVKKRKKAQRLAPKRTTPVSTGLNT